MVFRRIRWESMPMAGALLFLVLTLPLILSGCKKYFINEAKFPKWEVEILGPLVKTRLAIDKLVLDSSLVTNPDGSLSIIYDTTMSVFRLDDYLIVQDYSGSLPLLYVTQYVTNLRDSIALDVNEARLTRFDVKTGNLSITVNSEMDDSLFVTISTPWIYRTGNPLDTFYTAVALPPGAAGNPVIFTADTTFAGYTFDLTKGGLPYNSFVFDFNIQVHPPAVFTASDIVNIDYSISNLWPNYAAGYFGKDTLYLGSDTVSVNFFKIFQSGMLHVANPKAKVVFKNSFGIDNTVIIDTLVAINTRTGNQIDIFPLGQFTFSGATIPGETKVDTIVFDKNNTNVISAFEIFPDKVGYGGSVAVNSNGDSTLLNNFVTDSSMIDVRAEVELPLDGYATDLVLVDTLKFDLTATSTGNAIKEGTFIVKLDNWFPLGAEFQAYFLDSKYKLMDSLFIDGAQTVTAGNVGVNNIVTSSTHSELKIFYSEDRMEKIKQAKYISLWVRLNSKPTNTDVKIYDWYYIDTKITGDFIFRPDKL